MHAGVVDYDLRTHDVIASGVPMKIHESVAQTPVSPAPPTQVVDTSYDLQTSSMNWNTISGDFAMPSQVNVTRPGTDATSDKAKGNTTLGTASMIGNVVVHDNGSAPEARDAGADYQGPSTITTDELSIDSRNRVYDALGNFRFVQGNRIGTSHRGVLNQAQHTLHLEGSVVLAEGQASMRAEIVDYNLQTRDVRVSGSPIIIRQPVPPRASSSPTQSPSPKAKRGAS